MTQFWDRHTWRVHAPQAAAAPEAARGDCVSSPCTVLGPAREADFEGGLADARDALNQLARGNDPQAGPACLHLSSGFLRGVLCASKRLAVAGAHLHAWQEWRYP